MSACPETTQLMLKARMQSSEAMWDEGAGAVERRIFAFVYIENDSNARIAEYFIIWKLNWK